MLKNWMHDVALAIQARSGLTAGFFVWLAIMLFATLTAFAFLCVAAYDWLSLQFGSIYAALVMAGIFILIASDRSVRFRHVAPPRQRARHPRARRARAQRIVVAA